MNIMLWFVNKTKEKQIIITMCCGSWRTARYDVFLCCGFEPQHSKPHHMVTKKPAANEAFSTSEWWWVVAQ